MERERRGLSKILGVIVLSLLLPASVFAVPVTGIQFYLQGGPMFYQMPPGELTVAEYHLDPGLVSGRIKFAATAWEDYEIRDAQFTMTSTLIVSDDSYTVSNPMNPKIAKGNFGAGSIMTIEGSITTKDGATTLFSKGIVLQAQVSSIFTCKEKEGLPANFMNMQMQLDVIGGELATGTQTGFVLNHLSISDIALAFCSQPANPGGNVQDFKSNIWYLAPSNVKIYPVPEPLSLGLFGLSSLLVVLKRSKKRDAS